MSSLSQALAFLAVSSGALAVPMTANLTNCTGDCARVSYRSPAQIKMMAEKRKNFKECRELSLATHGAVGCPTIRPSTMDRVPCEGGQAGEYACMGVDLLAYVGMDELGSSETNDIWGWTDPELGNEIAMVSLFDGTSFVDITDPVNPVVLGKLDTHEGTLGSDWGDIKIFEDVAYIGSEAVDHGMQIFDLVTLREYYGQKAPAGTVRSIPEQLHYDGFGSSHNIVINEDTGFLYAVGSKTCDGGPHIVDIRQRLEPQYVGCFDADGYTHDAEVVVYTGPDEEFQGREIMFGYNTRANTLTIVDMTDHNNPEIIGQQGYEFSAYCHQGWLTDDQTHLFMGDEADENRGGLPTQNTRTLTWDVSDLRNPVLVNEFFSEETVIDHNQYVLRDFIFQSNYCAGLQILKIEPDYTLTRAGFFDNAPDCSTTIFSGSWSNYPYFESGSIVFTSIERGLFIVDASVAMGKKKLLANATALV